MFIVPLNSFRFLSQFNLNLLDLSLLRCCSGCSRLVLRGTRVGLCYSSSLSSLNEVRSFLLRERVELNILLALTSSRFFLLFRRALLRSCSPSSSTESFLSEKVWLIILEHSDMVSQLISIASASMRSVKQEVNFGGINFPFSSKNIFLYTFFTSNLNFPQSQAQPAQNFISLFLRAIISVSMSPLYLCYCCLVANPLQTLINFIKQSVQQRRSFIRAQPAQFPLFLAHGTRRTLLRLNQLILLFLKNVLQQFAFSQTLPKFFQVLWNLRQHQTSFAYLILTSQRCSWHFCHFLQE